MSLTTKIIWVNVFFQHIVKAAMFPFTSKLNLTNKNIEKNTLTGPVIQQNGLAISYVCFLRKYSLYWYIQN